MGASKRVWVLDGERPASGVTAMAQPGAHPESRQRGIWSAVPERTGGLLFGCYLFGPLALLWLKRGRSRFLWAALGLGAVAFWAASVWRWDDIARWLVASRIPFGPWFIGTLVVSGIGLVTWIRAIVLTGMDIRFDPQGLPRWMRGPVVAGGLSLLAPGAGLLATGALGRAAFAAWNASLATLAALLLWKAPWLWRTNGITHYWPLAPDLLEGVFLVAAGVGFAAALGWIASVLDSVRGGLQNTRPASVARLDRLTLALLLLLVVACAASEPRLLARDSNEMASTLQHQGMRHVPLALARLARVLDPARPAYAMHVASLLDTCGDADAAALVRAELHAQWQEYSRLLAAAAPTTTATGVAAAASAPVEPPVATALDSTAAAAAAAAPAGDAASPPPAPKH